jgi:hypothetical protein
MSPISWKDHVSINKDIVLKSFSLQTLYFIDSSSEVKPMQKNSSGDHVASLLPGENYIGVCEYKNAGQFYLIRAWYNFKWIKIILEEGNEQKTDQQNHSAKVYNGNYNVTTSINLTSNYPLNVAREVITDETITLEIYVDVHSHPVKMTLNATVSDPTFTDLKAGTAESGYKPVVKEIYWDSNSQGKVPGTSLTFEIPQSASNNDSCSLVIVIEDFNEKSGDRIWGGSGKLVYISFVPQ